MTTQRPQTTDEEQLFYQDRIIYHENKTAHIERVWKSDKPRFPRNTTSLVVYTDEAKFVITKMLSNQITVENPNEPSEWFTFTHILYNAWLDAAWHTNATYKWTEIDAASDMEIVNIQRNDQLELLIL